MCSEKYCLLLILNFFWVLDIVSSARILAVYLAPFHSHQSVFHVLTEELARQGHELIVLAPDTQTTHTANVTLIDVHDKSFKTWEESYRKFTESRNSFSVFEFWTEMIIPTIDKLLDVQLGTPEMQAIIRDPNQHFDVILAEANAPMSIIVGARFKAPIIRVSSLLGTDEIMLDLGASVHPIIFPDTNSEENPKHSFFERLAAVKTFIELRIFEKQRKTIENNIIQKYFGKGSPTIEELKKNVHMLLLSAHHIWDNNRPVPPSVVYMGALHLKKTKPIPEHLKTYLDSSKNGVVYLSLGSKVKFSDISPATVKIFLEVFKSLPFEVLIKWNGGELSNKPANVRLEKWLPQNDLLHHPKIKAFIMQGGLQSIDEAIAAKVPLIACPVFGDQFFNSQRIVQLGIGKQLKINQLEKDNLREAIMAVAQNDSYRETVTRLSRIMEEQRADGLQKAVYWIDYIAKYGALHLKSPLADETFTNIIMMDILVAGALTLAILLTILYVLGKLLYSHINTALNNHTKLKSR